MVLIMKLQSLKEHKAWNDFTAKSFNDQICTIHLEDKIFSYRLNFSGRTEHGNDVIFFVFFGHCFRQFRGLESQQDTLSH